MDHSCAENRQRLKGVSDSLQLPGGQGWSKGDRWDWPLGIFDLWVPYTVHFAVLSYQIYLTQNVHIFKTSKFMKVETADIPKEMVSFPDIVEDRELSCVYFYTK